MHVEAPHVVRYVISCHSWGGYTGYHDYLMSDGTIETMKTEEAARRQMPQPSQLARTLVRLDFEAGEL